MRLATAIELYRAGAEYVFALPATCSARWGAEDWARAVVSFRLYVVDVGAPGFPGARYWVKGWDGS
jgi:hypothetical protein